MPPPFPAGPFGLATTPQLHAAGWTDEQIEHFAATRGYRLLPGVYVGHRGPVGEEARLRAGFLWAGAGAALTGAFAVQRHGVPLPAAGPALFVVGRSKRNRATPWVRALRTARVPRTRILNGIAVANLERALVDAGRFAEVPPGQLRAATIAALQRRLVTPERVVDELRSGRPNGTAVARGLRDFESGAWSMAEVVLGNVLRKGRPRLRVVLNPRLETASGTLVGVPDAYLHDHGVAVLVHSRQYHDGVDEVGRERWELTVEADSVYEAHGVASLAVAPTTLRYRPEWFLRRLDQVIAAQAGRPRPRVRIAGSAPTPGQRDVATLSGPSW